MLWTLMIYSHTHLFQTNLQNKEWKKKPKQIRSKRINIFFKELKNCRGIFKAFYNITSSRIWKDPNTNKDIINTSKP